MLLASGKGHGTVVNALLLRGADVNQCDVSVAAAVDVHPVL